MLLVIKKDEGKLFLKPKSNNIITLLNHVLGKKYSFVVLLFLRQDLSLYSPDQPRTFYADQAGLELTEFHLLLSPKTYHT